MLRFSFSPKVAEIISDSSKLITFQLTVIPENRMHLSLSHHLYQSPKITLIGPTWVPLDPSLFPVLASHGYTSSQLGRWNHMIDSPMRIIRSRGRTMPQRKGVSESRSIVSDSLWPHGILQARILEWVAISSSKGSSQPRGRTQVSHTAGGFFTIWATREAQNHLKS